MHERAERERLWTDVHSRDWPQPHGRRSTLKWFRAGKVRGSLSGFIVSWDADSRDRAMCGRLQRFIYGYETTWEGRLYRHPGFIERDGVRYLGQSVLLVREDRLRELLAGLADIGVDFEADRATIG